MTFACKSESISMILPTGEPSSAEAVATNGTAKADFISDGLPTDTTERVFEEYKRWQSEPQKYMVQYKLEIVMNNNVNASIATHALDSKVNHYPDHTLVSPP